MERGISPERALELVLAETPAGRVAEVSPANALGLVVAETVTADRDYPPFARAMMDGYAVRLADAGRTVPVVGEVAAGQNTDLAVAPGNCVSIMTGAPCPAGTEAVVPKEQVVLEERGVRLPAGIEGGQHVAPQGSEVRQGEPVLREGTVVTPLGVGVLASVGCQRVRVFDPPRVAVIATGDELVPAGAPPGPAQIRNSNGPMLAAAVRRIGLAEPALLHARDTLESLAAALAEADAARADLVLLSGGVSAGRYDLVPEAVAAHGATILLHKVTQKPGKPLFFARKGTQLLFGLPGNPLSSHFCFHRYVAAAARLLAGRPPEPPTDRGVLASPLETSSERTLFLTARVEREGERWRVTPWVTRGSADHFGCPDANAYITCPPGTHRLEAGTPIDFEWMGEPR
jgi:molybdopterin molybdotransferase